MNMELAIAERLSRHDVTFFALPEKISFVKERGFKAQEFAPPADSAAAMLKNLNKLVNGREVSGAALADFMVQFLDFFSATYPEKARALMKLLDKQGVPDLIMCDAFNFAVFDVALHRKIPLAIMGLGFYGIMNFHDAPWLSTLPALPFARGRTFFSRVSKLISMLRVLPVAFGSITSFNNIRASVVDPSVVGLDFHSKILDYAVWLVPIARPLEYARPIPGNFFEVSVPLPSLAPERKEHLPVKAWLDSAAPQTPTIFVAFGSQFGPKPANLVNLVKEILAVDAKVRIVLATRDKVSP
jgi:UDP:flavonoid glycosyltransferase YjiC (YdhE family)